MAIQIVRRDTHLEVQSPYYPEWLVQARRLGGRWDPVAATWSFDVRDEAAVRTALREVYGTDGEGPVELVDVALTLVPGTYARTVFALGREIAHRPGRDAPVRLGEGVRILRGTFPARGGSAKYPAIGDLSQDVVLLVRDVPRDLALRARERSNHVQVVEAPDGVVPQGGR